MRHQVNKIKIKKGKDAARATVRKLALNFISHGKIVTTLTKAKTLKSFIERLVFKAKEKSESRKNILLSSLGKKEVVEKLFSVITPKFNEINSGFVRVVKLGRRLGDGAEMGKVEWVRQIMEVKSPKSKVKRKLEKKDEKINTVNQTGKK